MRRLVTIILLVGAFLGGYYVAQKPGAPRLSELADKATFQAEQMGQKLQADGQGGKPTWPDKPVYAKTSWIEIRGKLYKIGL